MGQVGAHARKTGLRLAGNPPGCVRNSGETEETVRRHHIRNASLGLALLLVGLTAPLSLTKGNEVVGGNATLVALWVLTTCAAVTWLITTDFGLRRLKAGRRYLPSVKVSWTPPEQRVWRRDHAQEMESSDQHIATPDDSHRDAAAMVEHKTQSSRIARRPGLGSPISRCERRQTIEALIAKGASLVTPDTTPLEANRWLDEVRTFVKLPVPEDASLDFRDLAYRIHRGVHEDASSQDIDDAINQTMAPLQIIKRRLEEPAFSPPIQQRRTEILIDQIAVSQKQFEDCGELIKRGYALKGEVQRPTIHSIVTQAVQAFGVDLLSRIERWCLDVRGFVHASSVGEPRDLLAEDRERELIESWTKESLVELIDTHLAAVLAIKRRIVPRRLA